MGKKYIVELKKNETLYKRATRESDGTAYVCSAIGTPYTEPDMEQVRKEAYENGYENGFIAGHLKAEKSGQSFYEDGYQRGMADANRDGEYNADDGWYVMQKISLLPNPIKTELFGTAETAVILQDNSFKDALDKLTEYEQEKEEQIQVGDEVIRHYKSEFAEGDDAPSIFLSEEDGYFRCLAFNGRSIMIAEYPKNQYRKTGRHFPEIAEVIAKMKES